MARVGCPSLGSLQNLQAAMEASHPWTLRLPGQVELSFNGLRASTRAEFGSEAFPPQKSSLEFDLALWRAGGNNPSAPLRFRTSV